MQIKNRKLSKTGNSYCFTIPMQYIKDELIEKTKEYNITVTETKK